MRRLTAAIILATMAAPAAAQDKNGTQWSPYVEWSLANPSASGNPYDLIATATFRHTASGETHATQMFYDGNDTWKFRFTATRTGEWTYSTSSGDPDLNGKSGKVTVSSNGNGAAHGFLKKFGGKWGWQGTEEAFVPQLVMYGGPNAFHSNPGKVDSDIQNFMGGHGFNGFHVPTIAMGWFDINQTGKGYDTISSSNPNPDRRTFEAMELLITKAHAAGGMVHFWVWGDESRKQTPNKWGKNSTVDKRLQRYIGARLGPLPGWSVGYGFDLDEWVSSGEITTWHGNMHQYMGWTHFVGGRPAGPNSGTNHSAYNSWNQPLDYSSYEHHRPSYDVYVAALNEIPGKPVMSEDRFRIRNEGRSKDYDEVDTRRGLYHSTMAGGVANIWGNLLGSSNGGGSVDYPNKAHLKTYARFFENRFSKDLSRANNLTNGVALKSGDNKRLIFYRENASSVQMDLSGVPNGATGIAVDAKKAYSEIQLGSLSNTNQTWAAPYSSDWAIWVESSSGGGGGGATVPTAPTNLAANAVSSSQINLSWNDNSNNEDDFQLQRSPDNSSWSTVATPGANASSASDSGLPSGTTYYYRIRARNSAGNSPWSNVASATTQTAGGGGGGGGGGGSGITLTNTAPSTYTWFTLGVGTLQYVDRAFTFSQVPAAYDGLDLLQTENDDKGSSGTVFITFDVDQDVTVCVAHDDRFTTKPGWMAGFVDTGDDLVSGGGTFSLYCMDFTAGTVTLGGNNDAGQAANSMYSVVVAPVGTVGGGGGSGGGGGGGGPTDSDGDGLTDADEVSIYGTDPNAFDTDGDGSSDGIEVAQGTDPLDPTSFPGSGGGSGSGSGSGGGKSSGSGGACGALGLEALLVALLCGLRPRRRTPA